MKKLALSLAVLFAVGMVSCGGNKDNNNADSAVVEETAVEVVETPDSANAETPADSANVEAPADSANAETPAAN